MFNVLLVRVQLALVREAARLLYVRDRPDTDGTIEWLEGADSGNGWAFHSLETLKWAHIKVAY